ncbi:hypothetical protein [Bartonella quintana]|uniref:Uncharacterized protein n=2 Tax=Bartonella quintana TaxID=803 RepID=W3U2P1_BARQI|nr:hypothetical protein [Bartonella quintana]ETS12882.1 hypothetical protein Q651_00826 [Bartonella quintana BQ2-D70]ETS14696.1 hypothetical protein Q650_00083 [Bartonella quintana JK 73rel]ETS17129.1 hypothetical protein Q649_00084 [Bartonella quintana JK 73]ETS17224.1 hypothetical protein Q648_00941 [Bartonella quintana JK 12]ETS19422.1 hypothetical protein Q647_00083 [Bartonella quintana JK 7]
MQSSLEATYEESKHGKLYRVQDLPLLSPKTLDKKAYNSLLSSNYVEGEKAFCAFRHRF